ncbi:hypothetical protein [Psychroserpens sp. SPM9]|uniref:hypothetical protein n=1 Tax=Psychroserpens sp. SPM9 TaxID=2975598 RepID=UPI0021A2EF17|nr:hypothetical protein [Psychroserpens sp. SPM9]MDG5493242.1 hypothetical protein [Psychroserpens sp. SPM9]
MKKEWLTKGNHQEICCGNCGSIQNEIAAMDHHSGICSNCNISCVWYYLTNENVVQIIPEFAPNSIKLFIEWCQSELDELEIIELIIELEKIGKLD